MTTLVIPLNASVGQTADALTLQEVVSDVEILQTEVSGLQANQITGFVGFTLNSDMTSNLNFPANTVAQVFSTEPTPALRGFFKKVGASGTGSWAALEGPPTITINLTVLADGATPTASVTGSYPSLTLNLGLSSGIDGETGKPGEGFTVIGLPTEDPILATDITGNALFRIDSKGDTHTNSLTSLGTITGQTVVSVNEMLSGLGAVPRTVPTLELQDGTSLIFCLTDINGNVLLALDSLGNFLTAQGGSSSSQISYLYDATTGTHRINDPNVIEMHIGWGQSWDEGKNQAADTTYDTTALDPSFSLMPNSGVRPAGAAFTSFVNLVEGTNATNSKNSIGSRLLNVLQSEYQTRFGAKTSLLWAVAALGGTEYELLKKGTPIYQELLRLVSSAVTIALTSGKRIVVAGIYTMHGQEDYGKKTSRKRYARYMRDLIRDLNNDISVLTNQKRKITLFVAQCIRGSSVVEDVRIATAQLDAADQDSNIVCVGPNYWAPADLPNSFGHLSTLGYSQCGEWFGDVVKRHAQGRKFEPVRVVEKWWIPGTNTFRLQYSLPVMIDTSGSIIDDSLLGNGHGVDFLDGSGSPPTISSVASVASPIVLTVSGSDVTLSGPGSGVGNFLSSASMTGDNMIYIINNGEKYGVLVDSAMTWDGAATLLASVVPGASASGLVITVSSPVSMSAGAHSDQILVTLSGAPASRGRPRVFVASKLVNSPGSGSHNNRSTVRYPVHYAVSSNGQKLYHWACIEAIDLFSA